MTRPWIVISSQMLGPCAYVWKKSNPDGADIVMYVGASANGVRRFAGHHALPYEYAEDDYIELFPCASLEGALQLEQQLIRDLQPYLNKRGNTKICHSATKSASMVAYSKSHPRTKNRPAILLRDSDVKH